MTGARWRWLAVLGLLIAAAGGLLMATRPWWMIHTDGVDVGMSGSASSGGLATVLALVVGGGVPLLVILRRIGRRLVGVVVALAGLGMALTGGFPSQPGAEQIRAELRQHTLAEATGLSVTGWPIGYLVVGIIAVLAAVIVVGTAGRWPVRADRFDRRRMNVHTDDPHEVWMALDAGFDPTVSNPEGDDAP